MTTTTTADTDIAVVRAGFDAVDVHMSDIIAGRRGLAGFSGLAACGGFSYGDVLGAGEGWAKSILFNARARDQFEAFFTRADVNPPSAPRTTASVAEKTFVMMTSAPPSEIVPEST